MQNPEIDRITKKIETFMAGTTWGCISIYFREGKVQKYEEIKTELAMERLEVPQKNKKV